MGKIVDNFSHSVESQICGIPCIIGISHYVSVAGNPYTWDSDMDYYGYTEMEWEVLDRKGYEAKWLKSKLTDEIRNRIEKEIDEFMNDLKEEESYYNI